MINLPLSCDEDDVVGCASLLPSVTLSKEMVTFGLEFAASPSPAAGADS